MSNNAGADWRYYAYDPSKVLAGIAIGLFGFAFFCHLAWQIKTRAWYMTPFTIAMLGESVGYGVRILSAEHPTGRGDGLTFYIIQELFIILCPALMAASHYMCFGRLINFIGQRWTPVSSKWVTAIFVTFDVISFCVQGAGGSLYSSDNVKIYPTAKAILLVGFIIQIISFGIFAIFAIIYQVRVRRAGVPEGQWTICLYTLYLGTIFILIRGIFRCIEFGTGTGNGKGPLLSVEGWYYGLETLPIVLAGYLFILSYVGRYIPHKRGARHEIAAQIEAELNAADGIYPQEEAGIVRGDSSEKVDSVDESTRSKAHWWNRKK
ncbi:RTA1 domain-containing protein [Sporobolomyces koalae]|uniref:RTA1 domain-containing protein n=1 Tax=Sporobolomyces koalae TaxID=500713 RepID=UPI003180C786